MVFSQLPANDHHLPGEAGYDRPKNTARGVILQAFNLLR
jgi:hypothetical protein